MSRKDKPIIEVKGLSKEYRIGMDRTYKRFTESFTNAVRHPIQALRGLGEPKDTFWALKDVNFEVERGEVLGIIGRNGAGKSTLLKILSRITYPTEGEIVMRGRVGSLLEVGTGFHPELTGRENIYFNGAILGMKKREIDDKFDEIVKFSGVEKFLDTPVKRYSSGMNVRLAFSVAAHLDPEILLVDEVLAVGDAEFQKKCLGKMGEVASEGRTVLFVSHNMKAIENLCLKACLLERGRLVVSGKITDVISQYMKSYGYTEEIVHVMSDMLIWKGISNRIYLQDVCPDENLTFALEFESTASNLDGLYVDFAIYNDREEKVIHSRSKYVGESFNIKKHTQFTIKYHLISPKLAPGRYHMTVYLYSQDLGVLSWIDNIDACSVNGKPYFGNCLYYEGIKSAIIPEFNLWLEY